ncbi:TonB family protein [Corallococcus sp. AB004]|uniref:TonB family protein n=1 Tax=Corallococcus TaxID=83461 RepID=UPI000EA2CE50|nr:MULTISPECIES: TonB family protein [Corallococcus]NPD28008.1 TonB family protein [Corallococcus exiguus]NRD50669.1 TonB family protein [Corallococcus exiguus]RKI01337.1 TonB family protein [Corallococcus sp. AB038B]RKI29389.1 TonB family protein [Corallococcus sp. AB004]
MAAARKNGLTLRITTPDGSIQETVSEAESVIVGSGAQAAVKIQDPRVSNLHVMLKVDNDGSVTAIDLGSEGGTQVSGQKLIIPTALKPGDVLTVGTSRVEVLFGEVPRPVAPAAAVAQPGVFQQRPVMPPAPPVAHSAPVSHAAPVPPNMRQAPPQRPAMSAAPTNVVGTVSTPRSAPAGALGTQVSQNVTSTPVFGPPPPPVAARKATPPQVAAARKPQPPPHLQEPLPRDAQPTPDAKVLQVSMLWGDQMLEVQHFKDGAPVTIGEGAKNTFTVFSPQVGKRHVLAVSKGDKVELRAPAGSGVFVTNNGDVRTKDALRAAGQLNNATSEQEQLFTLGLHDRAEVSLGTVAFVMRYVKPSPAILATSLSDRDFGFFKIAAICILAAAAFVAAMLLTPHTETKSADDVFESQQRVAKFLITPEKKVEAKKLQLSGVEEGAKAKDEEGKFGKEEAKQEEAAPSKPGTQVVDKSKKEKDRQVVGKVGLLGALKGMKGGASDVFGPGGIGTGINNSLGGLKGGAAMGDAHGVGGLGSRGTGNGGGGTALGIGGLGTQGNGRGTGGSGGIDLGGRGKSVTKVIPGKTTVIGGLDKDVIAKVIRRHQNEIKYCYESELNKNPSLAGKVAVAFTIDPAGAVADASVSESTLGSSPAEQCMISRIRRWKFPEPKGGGVVNVTYPWLFSPSGADAAE